jgi:hypothetical protein
MAWLLTDPAGLDACFYRSARSYQGRRLGSWRTRIVGSRFKQFVSKTENVFDLTCYQFASGSNAQAFNYLVDSLRMAYQRD